MYVHRRGRLESVHVLSALTTFRVAKIPYDAIGDERSYKKNLVLLRSHSAVVPTGADLKVSCKGTRAIKRYSKGRKALKVKRHSKGRKVL